MAVSLKSIDMRRGYISFRASEVEDVGPVLGFYVPDGIKATRHKVVARKENVGGNCGISIEMLPSTYTWEHSYLAGAPARDAVTTAINSRGGYEVGDTVLNVDSTAGLPAGATITIGSNSLTIASVDSDNSTITVGSGLTAAVSDGDTVTRAAVTTAINNSVGYAVGHTILVLDNAGVGGIIIGDTITIGANSYVVTLVLNNSFIVIESPGLVTAVDDDEEVIRAEVTTAIDNPGGYTVGTTTLTVDSTTGIIAEDAIEIGTNSLTVASVSGNVITVESPGLTADVADDEAVDRAAIPATDGPGGSINLNGSTQTADAELILPGPWIIRLRVDTLDAAAGYVDIYWAFNAGSVLDIDGEIV